MLVPVAHPSNHDCIAFDWPYIPNFWSHPVAEAPQMPPSSSLPQHQIVFCLYSFFSISSSNYSPILYIFNGNINFCWGGWWLVQHLLTCLVFFDDQSNARGVYFVVLGGQGPIFSLIGIVHYWFQPETSNFSTCTLNIWYHKTGTKISQPNSNCFQKLNIPVHYLLVELCTGVFYLFTIHSSVEKVLPVSVYRLFAFFQNLHYYLYISKQITIWREISIQTLK